MNWFICKESDNELAVFDLSQLVSADKGGSKSSIYLVFSNSEIEIAYNAKSVRDDEFTRLVSMIQKMEDEEKSWAAIMTKAFTGGTIQ